MGFFTTSIRFLALVMIKWSARLFYRFEVQWFGRENPKRFHNIRLILILNHTSLFEPIYVGAVSYGLLWNIAQWGTFPGADITMDRAIVGKIFHLLARQPITITRSRDESWTHFLAAIDEKSLVLIAPEGRMKRPNGLDKHGQPMTVKGGVVEILQKLQSGRMLIAYSGGLHHIQQPGQGLPKLNQPLGLGLEEIDIEDYLAKHTKPSPESTRASIIHDLEMRRDRICPLVSPSISEKLRPSIRVKVDGNI